LQHAAHVIPNKAHQRVWPMGVLLLLHVILPNCSTNNYCV